jgi:hypothetical protein
LLLLLRPLLLFSDLLHLLLYCRQCVLLLLHDRQDLLQAVAGLSRSCLLLTASSTLCLASTLLVECGLTH